jgi:hypothetical protein
MMGRRALTAAAAAVLAAVLAAVALAPRGAGAAVAPSVGVNVLVNGVAQPARFSREMVGPLALALFPTENNRFVDLGGGLRAWWSRYPDPYRTYWGVAGHSARAWHANLRPPPFLIANSTGILLSITGSLDPAEYVNPFGLNERFRKLMTATRVSELERVFSWRDPMTGINWGGITVVEGPSELTRPPDWGEPISLVYQFYFKSDQIFTVNFAKVFFAWLFNSQYGRVNVTATDGSTVLFDPMGGDAPNVPVDTFIVVGDGQTSFSRTAYRVAHEVARAEPSVQVQEGIALSAVFVFDRDVDVTEVAVYVKLTDGKEVMLLYYVYPQPVAVRAGQPFPVAFTVHFPFG